MKIVRRTAPIVFEGTAWDGTEMTCLLDVPMRVFFEFQRLSLAEDAESAYRKFGDEVLKGWNLEEDDGSPMPADGEHMLSLPPALSRMVISSWMEAVAEVPGPLAAPSPDSST